VLDFHVDGFARELMNLPERLVIPVPGGVSERDAACAPIAFSTVQHMLFDNAKLRPGETVLVHAGGSGIGTVAIMMAKKIGCTVITTVGDDSKIDGVKALGADHISNYRKDRFEHETHQKEGCRRGIRACRRRYLQRLVADAEARRQTRDLRLDVRPDHDHQPDAAFPAAISYLWIVRRHHPQCRREPRQDGGRMLPVIDTEVPIDDVATALKRMESRQVFGKIVVYF
jgi:alcohol dehydrogenase